MTQPFVISQPLSGAWCALMLVGMLAGCSSSRTAASEDAAADRTLVPDSGTDASQCPLLMCALDCELQVGRDGCPLCRCAPGPEPECRQDSDCVLATNAAECCAFCEEAFPASVAAAERCIVQFADPFPRDCAPQMCGDCPAIGCAPPADAVCEAGQCRTTATCGPGEVEGPGGCVPACEDDSDCMIARVENSCCPGCDAAFHRSVVDDRPCVIPMGQPAPASCVPELRECATAPCPDIACQLPEEAVCGSNGMCELRFR
ncbi:MAG: hypothetical protein AAGF12_13845 [Myxococcota bacterium]